MIEKVIKGLAACRWDECEKCQYHGQSDCFEELLADALALLKAQEYIDAIPVEWLREKMRNADAAGAWHNVDTIKWLIESWQKQEQDAQQNYEAAVEMTEYCERYEPTYNEEDGNM